MPIPVPQLGLVISYAYLWRHEHLAGQDEGVKNRPCVIVLAARRPANGMILVRVVPVTHRPPEALMPAIQLPAAVKRHLGLDDRPSWVMLEEINEFGWPGYDLRPVPGSPDSFAYGFLPPRLFAQIVSKLHEAWSEGRGRPTPRD